MTAAERRRSEEERTAAADAAFAQVRAAAAPREEGGLYFIGNVKGAKKYFPQSELREELYSAQCLYWLSQAITRLRRAPFQNRRSNIWQMPSQ